MSMLRMELSAGYSLELRKRMEKLLELSPEQRLLVQEMAFGLRMDLVYELHGERYEPNGQCPKCFRRLTPVEIIRGFNQSPRDFTTQCPKCRRRFEPSLVVFSNGVNVYLPFYCDIQTLEMMRGKDKISPEKFASGHPAVYRSAIVHHGNLRQAFNRIGVRYNFKEETHDWKNKVGPFLGRLPDTIIAECVDKPVHIIRVMRRKLGISRYTLSKSFEESVEL